MEKSIKKILILGASSDIGIEVVKIFLNKSWQVIAHYNVRNQKLLKLKRKFNNKKVSRYHFSWHYIQGCG